MSSQQLCLLDGITGGDEKSFPRRTTGHDLVDGLGGRDCVVICDRDVLHSWPELGELPGSHLLLCSEY